MSRTSSTVKNRYRAKAYDRIDVVVPAGRKADIEQYAKGHGEKTNGLIGRLLRQELNMSQEEWKARPTSPQDEL